MDTKEETTTAHTFQGRCFCGAVELTASGAPAGMGYCHCDSCRRWSAAPVNAFTLWPAAAVTVTKGRELVGVFNKSDNSFRKWCTKCGGHLMTEHPRWGLVDVYAAVLGELPFEAHVHVNYQETVLRLHDSLPKQRDLPKELGGSNTLIVS
ncbi:MAG TPA: GFA family protein [Polyangia bacterium]|nr:GFA family protein [Polyangia bacterium]